MGCKCPGPCRISLPFVSPNVLLAVSPFSGRQQSSDPSKWVFLNFLHPVLPFSHPLCHRRIPHHALAVKSELMFQLRHILAPPLISRSTPVPAPTNKSSSIARLTVTPSLSWAAHAMVFHTFSAKVSAIAGSASVLHLATISFEVLFLFSPRSAFANNIRTKRNLVTIWMRCECICGENDEPVSRDSDARPSYEALRHVTRKSKISPVIAANRGRMCEVHA